MTKQFLYIVDPLPSLNVKTDTTLTMIEEACARGVKTFACEIKDIFLRDGEVYFRAASVFLPRGYSNPPRYLDDIKSYSSNEFDAIFMRKDPPVDDVFLSGLLMLRCCKKNHVFNDPDGLLVANEKLFGQHIAAQFFAPTLVTSTESVIRDFVFEHERVVLKPLFKAGGSGVLVFDKKDRNLASALELLTQSYSIPIIVQSYIKNARLGDKRILILGGEPLGAVLRIPHEDDHRANFHAGGSGHETEISARDNEIVDALKPHLLNYGLHFVGIDVIGGSLTEINVTSPTGLIEIEQLCKKPLRTKVFDYVEKLVA